MHELADAPLLSRAHGAAADRDWRHAYELFVEADARQPLEAPDLAIFANCAYAAVMSRPRSMCGNGCTHRGCRRATISWRPARPCALLSICCLTQPSWPRFAD